MTAYLKILNNTKKNYYSKNELPKYELSTKTCISAGGVASSVCRPEDIIMPDGAREDVKKNNGAL